ncbi:putative protein XRI1 [Helianthus anomalus]
MVIIKVAGYGAGMEMNNNNTQFYDQPLINFDNSSGYLEDALFEFRSKRRRLMMAHDDHPHYLPSDQNTPPSFPRYWDFNTAHDLENFGEFKFTNYQYLQPN